MTEYFRDCLKRELASRLARNPRYSMRAFALALEVPVSTLSRALAGKRSLSPAVAHRIAEGLCLSPRERGLFFESLSVKVASSTAPAFPGDPSVTALDEESFQSVADWQHYAILEMTYLRKFRADPVWIAQRLGISTLEAGLAIERLQRVGLLEVVGKKWRKTQRTIWANRGGASTNAALRRYQQQCLKKAVEAVDELPFERRTSSAMTMPIDPAKLPLARRLIEEFSVELCRTLATGAMTDVFQLTINFHSLFKGTES